MSKRVTWAIIIIDVILLALIFAFWPEKKQPLDVIHQGEVRVDEFYFDTGHSTLEVVEPQSTAEQPQQSMTVEHQRDLAQ